MKQNSITAVMSAGALDKRVTVQTFTTTRSANGAQVNEWADMVTVWANVEYIVTGNNEQYFGDMEMSVQRVAVTMRYRGDVRPKMRLVYDIDGTASATFDVMYAQVLGRRKYERFICQSVE